MRKFLLYSSALVASGLLNSGVAEAACIKTPTCSSLGYESTTSCTGGLKCPFGNAWNCTLVNKITELEKIIEKNQAEEALKNCKIGDILYSDMSCNANMVASKTPIGVVFDTTNGLAIAKDEFANLVWGVTGDISGIQNYANSSTSTADWKGFINTKAIYDYEKSQGGYYPTMEKVLLYSTEGTSQGQWYLPAAGELKAISDNKDTLNTTLSKIGGTQMSGNYWTSSEQDSNHAWRIILGGSLSNERKDNRGTAKPIINFASKDKISVDLTNKSTVCKVGDILYSDKTCSASVVSGKTPIGVVFDGTNRLAVGLAFKVTSWSRVTSDIPGIPDITNKDKAIQNYSGKTNTAAIKAYDSSLADYPAAYYVYNYTTAGTKVGDWYLPALRELNEIYQNKTAIDKTLSVLVKLTLPTSYNNYLSSSETAIGRVWVLKFSNGVALSGYMDSSYYVLPVLAF